jgi:hypothetical protein
MSKRILWIWLGTLAIGAAMMLAGCGGRAQKEARPAPSDSSSTEVTLAATARYADATDEQARLARQIDRAAVIALAEQQRNDEAAATGDPTPGELLSTPGTEEPQSGPLETEPAEKELLRIDRFRVIPTTLVREPVASEREIELSLPAGSELDIELLDGLSSQTSEAGQRFRGRTTTDVFVDGHLMVPAGSEVSGTVSPVVRRKRIGGRAALSLQFDRLGNGASSVPLVSWIEIETASETPKDAATMAGGALAGALIGRANSKKKAKGAAVGTVIGAVVGAGVAVATKGETVELPVGTTLTLLLEEELRRTVRVAEGGSS